MQVAQALLHLAELYWVQLGSYKQARACHNRILDITAATHGADSLEYQLRLKTYIGNELKRDPSGALDLRARLQGLLDRLVALTGPDSLHVSKTLSLLASERANLQAHAESLEYRLVGLYASRSLPERPAG